MRQGPSPRRVRELSTRFGADESTITRWQTFWREHFPQTPFWKVARASFLTVGEIVSLPYSLVDAFLRRHPPREGWILLLRFPYQSRFPGACKSRSRNDPPRSAEDALRPRLLTGENGLPQSFHPVLRRRDDPTNSQSDRRLMGAVSILRGGLALELSPPRGTLQSAIRSLAAMTWSHPVTGREARFSVVTIARWYYTVRRVRDDPVGAFAAPCARTAARYPWQRPWLSSSIFSTAITRTGAINFTRQSRSFGEG